MIIFMGHVIIRGHVIIFKGSCDYLHGVMGLSSWGHGIIFMGSCDYLQGVM